MAKTEHFCSSRMQINTRKNKAPVPFLIKNSYQMFNFREVLKKWGNLVENNSGLSYLTWFVHPKKKSLKAQEIMACNVKSALTPWLHANANPGY